MKTRFYRKMLCCLGTAAFLASIQPARAMMLSDEELADLRGGFVLGGLQMDFAVTVETMVRNATEASGLATFLKIADDGGIAQSQTTAIGQGTELPTIIENATLFSTMGQETKILHRVMGNQIESLTQNRASDLSISQSTNIDVTMPGFLRMMDDWRGNSLIDRLSADSALLSTRR